MTRRIAYAEAASEGIKALSASRPYLSSTNSAPRKTWSWFLLWGQSRSTWRAAAWERKDYLPDLEAACSLSVARP